MKFQISRTVFGPQITIRIHHRSILIAMMIHVSYNVTLSLLVPYSTQAFAFITTFLALLVVSILATPKIIVIKNKLTYPVYNQ